MLCADCAFASVLPLPLAVLLALNSVQSSTFQLQVLRQWIGSVCSLNWSAVHYALVRRLIPLSDGRRSDAVCFLPPVRSDSLLCRLTSAGDSLQSTLRLAVCNPMFRSDLGRDSHLHIELTLPP